MKHEELVIMNKKGFTIAEIFIALAIVGVLTVVLFPVIQRSTPDQNRIMFRKTFNALSQAVSNMSFDDINYPESVKGTITDTGQSVPEGFNNQSGTYTAGTKFCTLLADQFNTIGTVTCGSTVTCNSVATAGWGSFTTSDGVDWRTFEGVGTVCNRTCTDAECTTSFPMNMTTHAYQSKIIIDIDGPDKGPNCSADSNAASFGLTQCSWWNACDGGSIPSGTKTADQYIIGVRFDGSLHLGSSDSNDGTATTDTDKCGSIMLSEATTNTQ